MNKDILSRFNDDLQVGRFNWEIKSSILASAACDRFFHDVIALTLAGTARVSDIMQRSIEGY